MTKFKTLLLVLFCTAILLTPSNDPDFGWHYKYGEYFVKNGRLLKDNIFSYTLPDYKWANSYWLAQVELYSLQATFGTFGPSLINGLVVTSMLAVILKKHSFSSKALFMTVGSVLLGTFGITVKPLYFSTILMLILLLYLLNNEEKKPYIVIPSIFLLWSNLHADFMLGLFVYGVYTTLNIRSFNPKALYKPMVMILIAGFVTLINPYGVELWKTLAQEIISYNKQQVNIKEHQSIIIYGTQAIALVAIAAAAAVGAIKYKTAKWYQITLVTFFLLSLNANYFYRVVVVHLLALIAINPNINIVKFAKKNIRAGLVFLLIAFLAQINTISKEENTNWTWSKKYALPKEAITYIKEHPINGNMLNNYNWGGYLIWQLPEHKTYVDGRMSAWKRSSGELFIEDYKRIMSAPYDNADLIDATINEYGITWLIDTPDSKLADFLIKERRWKVEYSSKSEMIVRMISL